jgi:hypothetical protein
MSPPARHRLIRVGGKRAVALRGSQLLQGTAGRPLKISGGDYN